MASDNSTGVYLIRNTANGKVYVGSAAKSIQVRWKNHRNMLRRGEHSNRHLQHAWNKYGEGAFSFETLEECEPQHCIQREQAWMDRLLSAQRKHGYNLSPTAGNTLGVKHTEASRKNMSKAHTGRQISAEQRAKMTEGVRRAYQKQEVRDRVSEATRKALVDPDRRYRMGSSYRGKNLSAEHCAKIGRSHVGLKHSEETRAKISKIQTGKVLTPKHRANIAAGNRGKKLSQETIEKMRRTKRKRCSSPEFRAKMAEIVRKQHEKERLNGVKRKCRATSEK